MFFRKLLAELGADELARGAALDSWFDSTRELLSKQGSSPAFSPLSALLKAWRWAERVATLSDGDRRGWASKLLELDALRHVGRGSLTVLVRGAETPEAAILEAVARETLLERLSVLDDGALRDRLVSTTIDAIAILEALRDDPPTAFGLRVRSLFPELAALAALPAPLSSIDHETSGDGFRALPLLDHVSLRVLGRKLAGLEQADRSLFQRDEALGAAAFTEEVARLERVRGRGLLPAVRAALIHLDFAKGGDGQQREIWRTHFDADLSVHNRAARHILERATPSGGGQPGVLSSFTEFRLSDARAQLVLSLVESHGLAGQSVRGETPLSFFAPWVAYLRRDAGKLADAMRVTREEAIREALDCLHLVNVCDTAGVREGLLGDALHRELLAIRDVLEGVSLQAGPLDESAIEDELSRIDDDQWDACKREESEPSRNRARLLDRLCRLRGGRQARGESREQVERVLVSLTDREAADLVALFRRCQFWYAEAGSGTLSPDAQLKVLTLGMVAAQNSPRIAQGRPFHVSLLPLVGPLHDASDRATPYRLRLVETMLAPLAIRALLDAPAPEKVPEEHPLATFVTEIGGAGAVELTFKESREAAALLTLLSIYETKSSAGFHATLKALCDLYGLRKDEFDRVANEAMYLATMNNARSDKERMLDHVLPGKIVEVGPGGGVVLDLLEQRFADSEIIGLDASHMVAEALGQRRELGNHRWRIVEADAFKLPEVVGEESVTTVVFCSVLHEIYSYVPYANRDGEVGRFRLESVRDLLRAAYRTLVKGGRLVIRDGVMPPPGVRIIQFLVPEAREFFDLFCRQFEGRRIVAEAAGEGRVRLSSADAMEFLYTYTWGPESFPYEVREQYGVLPYDEYRAQILAWLSDEDDPPTCVPLPKGQASYLQDGYRRGLAGKVALFDGDGAAVALPDSNGLLVFEKG